MEPILRLKATSERFAVGFNKVRYIGQGGEEGLAESMGREHSKYRG